MMDEPHPVLYMRRYVYTHYSTGKVRKTPEVVWQVVKNPRPGDYRYERGELVTCRRCTGTANEPVQEVDR